VTARHCTASASPPSTWYAPTATSATAPAAPTSPAGTLPPPLAAPTANHYEQAGLTGGRQPPQASSPCQASPPSHTANQATASAARGR
jgi:hypothetical protein